MSNEPTAPAKVESEPINIKVASVSDVLLLEAGLTGRRWRPYGRIAYHR